MVELKRIRDDHEVRLSDSFLSSQAPHPIFGEDSDALEEIGVVRDLSDLDRLIQELMENHSREDTAIDRELAISLHEMLSIDRRVAFDKRFWGWLGLQRYPEFVAWRWGLGSPRQEDGVRVRSKDRFFGGHVRQAFARLWWAVELTVGNERDYDLTKRLLSLNGFQDAYETFFGRAFCQYRPALKSFIEVVGDKPEPIIRGVAREFGFAISSKLLEALEEERIKSELTRILDDVEGA